jgi:hypothetical protein
MSEFIGMKDTELRHDLYSVFHRLDMCSALVKAYSYEDILADLIMSRGASNDR